MTILAYVGECPHCGATHCFTESSDWICKSCSENVNHLPEKAEVPTVYAVPSDRDGISTGMQVDDRKNTAKIVDTWTKEGGSKEVDGARMGSKIPSSIYHSRLRDDPHYWKDPKNVAKHRRWNIGR